MYDNIGGKLKLLAKIIFYVQAISSAIGGLAVAAIDDDMVVYGLLIFLLGPLCAWVSSWFLYGFGELIETNSIIAKKISGEALPQSNTAPKAADAPKKDDRLERLDRLYADGLITEQEYQQAISK